MLIARAPTRISYAGGGTDMEPYSAEHGGMVVSAAIDKYFYVFISPNGGSALQISSSDYRAFLRYGLNGDPIGVGGELKHADAALQYLDVTRGYSVFMASQVPAGTGLGSSSAVAVALVKGLSTLKHMTLTKAELAEAACEIELVRLSMPIGRQDQYASAFGGINAIYFSSNGVQVEKLTLPIETIRRLEDHTMLFYTGLVHDSSVILRDQKARMTDPHRSNVDQLHLIKQAAIMVREALLSGDISGVGRIMNDAWMAKKRLSPDITNETIDAAYGAACQAGAIGGKIAGAGGGGFMLFICPPSGHAAVEAALHQKGLVRADFNFDFSGARVLMNNVAD
jgi:D-glycero-alpha-D-manno-heptose-7-phosphate kinase